MAAFRYSCVKLTYRSRAEISRVLVLCVSFRNSLVYFIKMRIADDGFASQHQLSLEAYLRGNIIKDPGILSNNLTYFTVSSGDSFLKRAFSIGKNHGKSVHLPAEKTFLVLKPGSQILYGFCFVERKHGAFVRLLGKLRQNLVADSLGGRTAEYNPGLFFESLKLVIETVILEVGHYLIALNIVNSRRFVQGFDKILHSLV